MPDEIVCPRCLSVNDARNEFCTGCRRSLTDAAEVEDTNPRQEGDDRQDIQEELASVHRQLTEATDLLGSLQDRVTRLETRISRDVGVHQAEPRGEAAEIAEEPAAYPESESAADVSSAYIPDTAADSIGTLETPPDRTGSREFGIRIDWEQVLGRNWFAIIGGIAVVLGIGFFLKLAFDNNWIGDTGRIVLGVVVGLGLLGVGEYAQRRVPRWAQPVTASGAAILYLSIYAAFGLYQLIRPDAAFLLLAVVVTVAVLLALRYESIVIALLGVVGAFISPMLLGTDLPDERLALAYILLVDVGILAISAFRNWRWLTLVGWAGSYGIFLYWLTEFPGYEPIFTQVALTGVFLTFAVATPLFHILWRRLPGIADLSLMSINAIGYFLLTVAILSSDYGDWFGVIAFSLAAFYGLIALAALKRSGTPARIALFSVPIAIVFLTMAFPLQFDAYSVAIGWAAQGAATVWLSFRLGRWQTRAFGIAVLLLAVSHLILFDAWVDTVEGYIPVFNLRLLATGAVIAALYIVSLLYWRNRGAEERLKIQQWELPSALAIANLVTLGLFSLEIVNYFYKDSLAWSSILAIENAGNLNNAASVTLTLMWAVYGAVVVTVGMLGRYPFARWGGLAILGVAVWKLLIFDTFEVRIDPLSFIPLLNIRFAAFAVVLVLLMLLTFWFKRRESRLTAEEKPIFPILLIAANVVALWMLSQEVIYFFDSLGARQGGDNLGGMHLSLTVLWAVYGSAAVAAGMLLGYEPARWGGLALLGMAVGKLLLYDSFNVHIDPLSFVPFLNIRFLAFVIVLGLLALLTYWFKRRESSLTAEEKPIFPILLVVANVVGLWMLSQEVIYYFDSLGEKDVSGYFSGMHLSLTVLWAVYSMGVISAGIATQSSRIRLAGIGLLAIPVGKLFAFDVFLLDMAYRVAAFLTLGCMLLGMGLVYQRYSRAVRGFLFGRGLTEG